MSLSSIKERLASLRAEIDASDEVIRKLQTDVENETQRAEDAEEEAKKLSILVREQEDRSSDIEDNLRDVKLRFNEIEAEADENKRCCKVLDLRVQSNDDVIKNLENLVEQQTSEIERFDKATSDLQSQSQQMETKSEDAEDKGAYLKSKVDEMMEELTQLKNNKKSLEASGKKAEEKCDQHETFCVERDRTLQEALVRAEEAEHCSQKLRDYIEKLEEELEDWKLKKRSVEAELEQINADICDI